jgi:hypothetical protein
MKENTDMDNSMSDQQQAPGSMPNEVERAKARIRLYKNGRTILEVYGPHVSYEDAYVCDCKTVADWYACHADQIDAERYRWLRARHHRDSELCVVQYPQDAVKPGKYCPSLENLDNLIDKAMVNR